MVGYENASATHEHQRSARATSLCIVEIPRRLRGERKGVWDEFCRSARTRDRIAREHSLAYVLGNDDPNVITGQRTIALEIREQGPDVNAIVLPVVGGGLIASVSLAIRSTKPNVEAIGTARTVALQAVAASLGASGRAPPVSGNVDPAMLGRVIDRCLAADGRLLRLVACISDRPGGLRALRGIVAEAGASIREVTHDRVFSGPDVSAVSIVRGLENR